MTDPTRPGPGTLLGDFLLEEQIGQGGFATVYRAQQRRLNREAAVKILRPENLGDSADVVKRFLREVDLVRRLEHPNIVRLYEFGQEPSGTLWMAMELVRGRSLSTTLRETPRLPTSRALKIFRQMLSGLVLAHEKSIIHRDLKPGNVMLCDVGADTDHVKLLDFGIGKALGIGEDTTLQRLTLNQDISYGTPLFMAPEQILKDRAPVGPYSDVYSAGLVLYQMLTGAPAFQGASTYEILAYRLDHPVTIPPFLAGTLLGQVLEQATAEAVDARYSDAREFHTALAEVTGDDASAVGTPEPDTPSWYSTVQDAGPFELDVVDGAPNPTESSSPPSFEIVRGPEPFLPPQTTAASVRPVPVDLLVVPEGKQQRMWRLPSWFRPSLIPLVFGLLGFVALTLYVVHRANQTRESLSDTLSHLVDVDERSDEDEEPEERLSYAPPRLEPDPALPSESSCADQQYDECVSFALHLVEGDGFPRDEERAARLLEQACDGGFAAGCGNLASLLAQGRGVTYSPKRAAKLFEQACSKSHAASCHNLAQMYQAGVGVEASRTRAVELLKKACVGGHDPSCDELDRIAH